MSGMSWAVRSGIPFSLNSWRGTSQASCSAKAGRALRPEAVCFCAYLRCLRCYSFHQVLRKIFNKLIY